MGRRSSALVSAVVSCGLAELSSPGGGSRETAGWGFRGRDSTLVTLVSLAQSKCSASVWLAQVAEEGTAGSRVREGRSTGKTLREAWRWSLREMRLKSDGQRTRGRRHIRVTLFRFPLHFEPILGPQQPPSRRYSVHLNASGGGELILLLTFL